MFQQSMGTFCAMLPFGLSGRIRSLLLQRSRPVDYDVQRSRSRLYVDEVHQESPIGCDRVLWKASRQIGTRREVRVEELRRRPDLD